jgi:Tfp pilus assembly protein PilZ
LTVNQAAVYGRLLDMPKRSPEGTVEPTPPGDALGRIRVPFIHRGRLEHDGGSESLFLLDLGVSGAFVERPAGLPVGSRVVLHFPLPGNEIPVVVTCRVAWWHPPGGRLVSKALPAGLGLEFVEVSPVDRARLRAHLIGYLQGERSGRRFHRALPLVPDEEGAES